MRAAIMAACTVLALAVGSVLFMTYGQKAGPTEPAAAEPPAAASAPRAAETPAAKSAPASAPERIRIAAIGVDASIESMGLEENGALEVPTRADVTGWWSGGEAPGEEGHTVIVAHRDSVEGPAVFYEVPTLPKGTEVVVEDARGRKHTYTVDRIEKHDRDEFPTDAVYGSTSGPTLRLVTCGGAYDPERGYEDNYVAFASQAS